MKNKSSSKWYVLGAEKPVCFFNRGLCDLDLAIETICGRDLYLITSRMKEKGIELITSRVRSKRAEAIYEKAMRAIKSGRLKAREVDERDSEGKESVAVQFDDGRAWYLNPKPYGMQVLIKDFLEWALSERISLSDMISEELGFNKQYEGKFHPKKIVMQATAQVVWYYEKRLPITKLSKHPLIRQMVGYAYSSKNSFRDIVKQLDPRPKSDRRKPKAKEQLPSVSSPPKPIPGISSSDDGNFLVLKTACKALFNALKHFDPLLSSEELLSHPLVELCLVDRSEIIRDMAVDWLTEVEAAFPLCLRHFSSQFSSP